MPATDGGLASAGLRPAPRTNAEIGKHKRLIEVWTLVFSISAFVLPRNARLASLT